MGKKPSLTERFVQRVKNNRAVAVLVAAGVVLGGLAGFTDSLQKLLSLLPHREAHVDGEWHSVVFSDSSLEPPEPGQYYFVIRRQGNTLFGSVRAVEPPDQPTGRVYGISEGKIDGKTLSWYIVGGWKHVEEDGSETPEKENFFGVLNSDKLIHFTYQRDDSRPVEFVARRVDRRRG